MESVIGSALAAAQNIPFLRQYSHQPPTPTTNRGNTTGPDTRTEPEPIIPAGAYIIRNQMTSKVLHINDSNVKLENSPVRAFSMNQNDFRDQQIWWIEPLANHSDPAGGTVYSITNPGSGKVLDANPDSGWLYASQYHGAPWQSWKFRRVSGASDGALSYHIVNTFDDKVIDIDSTCLNFPDWVRGAELTVGNTQQCWELVLPVLTPPAGWFHIQNVGTNQLLRHDYVYNSPALVPAPDTQIESQYREQWAFQWTLTHSKCFNASTAHDPNAWCIVNRLTRSRLSPDLGRLQRRGYLDRDKDLAWKLELDAPGTAVWRITNINTSCVLERIEIDGAKPDLRCDTRSITRKGGQKWILSPPLLHPAIPLPPAYEDIEY